MTRLDLHGFTVYDAWKRFTRWIHEAQQDKNVKSVTVVTGQGKIPVSYTHLRAHET